MLRALSFSLLVVACGSDPVAEPDKGGGGTSGSGGGGGSGGTGASPACTDGPTNLDVCGDGPGFAAGAPLVDAGSVRATIVDAEGIPLADLMVFVCGTRVCSMPAYTDADGAVTIASPEPMEKPAFKFGDGLEVGRFAALLSESSGEVELGTIGTPRLPSPGSCLSPGTTAESGGVRLTLADGARVEVLPIDYPSDAERTFRAAELPLELAPPGLDAGEELDAIFALAPTGAVVCPPATLELPNTPGYAPGEEVDILVHGTDVDEGFAPYGGWEPVAVGRVDASGERIETIEGGLPIIANVAVRAR
jgi:hypothetical protein